MFPKPLIVSNLANESADEVVNSALRADDVFIPPLTDIELGDPEFVKNYVERCQDNLQKTFDSKNALEIKVRELESKLSFFQSTKYTKLVEVSVEDNLVKKYQLVCDQCGVDRLKAPCGNSQQGCTVVGTSQTGESFNAAVNALSRIALAIQGDTQPAVIAGDALTSLNRNRPKKLDRYSGLDKDAQPVDHCPDCCSQNIITKGEDTLMEYGEGADSVRLRTYIPVHHCMSCSTSFIGQMAQAIRHDVICSHVAAKRVLFLENKNFVLTLENQQLKHTVANNSNAVSTCDKSPSGCATTADAGVILANDESVDHPRTSGDGSPLRTVFNRVLKQCTQFKLTVRKPI